MKVIGEVKSERRTKVELSDREIALIHRGLVLDMPKSTDNDPDLHDDQYKIFSEFDTLLTDLEIEPITEE